MAMEQMDALHLTCHLSSLTVLVFHLFLTHVCKGQSELIGSSQPIVATLGEDVVLPCHLQPAKDAMDLTLEWTRPDLDPRFVYVWRSQQELVGKKHNLFAGRTSLFIDELKKGNISLKLSKVKLSDEGQYRCFIPALGKETFVQLRVAPVSSPVISLSGMDRDRGGVVLQCESAGWYPEPEVLWLDAEGNLLSAGPPETVRGPDDLYTVSSRVTVDKRHSNSFTCRVQQNNINQTRETHIHVPDDFFLCSSSSAVPIITGMAVSLAVSIMVILAGVFFVWRQNTTKTKKRSRDDAERGEKLLTEETVKMKVLEETKDLTEKYEKIEEELQKTKEELKNKTEEMEKHVNELKEKEKKLQEELETRNKELEDIKDEVEKNKAAASSSWFPWSSSSNKQTEEINELKEKKKLEEELETRNKELKKIKDEWEKKLKEEKEKRERAEKEVETLERKLKTEVEKLTGDNRKLQEEKHQLEEELETRNKEVEKLTGDNRKLQDEKQQLQEELETRNKELKEIKDESEEIKPEPTHLHHSLTKQNSSSSDSQETSGDITVFVDPNCNYICLRNMSDQDKPLGGRQLKVQINNREPITYTFDQSMELKAGKIVNLYHPDYDHEYYGVSGGLEWTDLKSWKPGDRVQATLQ